MKVDPRFQMIVARVERATRLDEIPRGLSLAEGKQYRKEVDELIADLNADLIPQDALERLEEAYETFYQECRREDSREHYKVFAGVALAALKR